MLKRYFLLVILLFSHIMHADMQLDQNRIDAYTKENINMLYWRSYKQMGYAAIILGTAYGVGNSIVNFNNNVNTLSSFVKSQVDAGQYAVQQVAKEHIESLKQEISNQAVRGTVTDAQVHKAVQQAVSLFGDKLQAKHPWYWNLVGSVSQFALHFTSTYIASKLVTLTSDIGSDNSFLKNAYHEVVSTFTTPSAQWYIKHYVPLYEHLQHFKTCAVYFDLESPFLQDVHNNAITLRYVQNMMQSLQAEDDAAAYAQFLQRKAEFDINNSQDLMQYDKQVAAYRVRKSQGLTMQEDPLLLQQLAVLHAQVVQDLEHVLGFIYAQMQHNKVTLSDFEQQFLKNMTEKINLLLMQISSLLQNSPEAREQASLQGCGIFTLAHELELYLKTTLRS